MNSVSRIFGQLFSEISRLADLESKSLHGQRRIKRRLVSQSQFQFEKLESRALLAGNFGYATVFKPTTSVDSPVGEGNAIAVDAAGNTYVTGSFAGTYDLGAGATTSSGAKDLFVAKLTPQGGTAWVRVIGSTGDDSGLGITQDSAGNVYLTGFFSGTVDFDPGAETFNLISAGGTDSFVLKLDNDGVFVNAMRLGGTGADQGMAIAVDPVNGEIFTTGFFNGTVNAGNGAPAVTSNGGEDVFVSIIANSNLLNQTFYKMGGTTNDRGLGLAIEPGRDVYVTGTFTGTADFDPNSGTFNLVSSGQEDAFVARLDASIFVWATRTGSAGFDAGRGIAVDPDGNVFSTGRFVLTVDFNPGSGTFNIISAGSNDAYVLKQDSAGNFIYARQIGGIGGDEGRGIALNADGVAYVTGSFQQIAKFGSEFNAPRLTASSTSATVFSDIFVAEMNESGTFTSVYGIGGGGSEDRGFGVAVSSDGSIVSTGNFNRDADFDPGIGVATRTSLANLGFTSVYVSKLTPDLVFNVAANAVLQLLKNGTNLEIRNIFDEANPILLARSPVATTRSVQVNGGTGSTSLTIDFRAGGLFALPGGIGMEGAAGQVMNLRMIGIGTEVFTAKPSGSLEKKGKVLAYGQDIRYENLDSISLERSLSVIVEPEGESQSFTVDSSIFNGSEQLSQISGTSNNGGTPVTITPIRFGGVPNVTIDTGANQFLNTLNDTVTVNPDSLVATGLKNLTVMTGMGVDILTVSNANLGLPVSGGNFWFYGGSGVDRLVVSGNTDWRLNDARVISGAGGRILIDDVERATMHGGSGANLLTAVGFSGSVILNGDSGADILRGAEGNDTLLGGNGNDWLYGNDGNDSLDGQGNNDWLFGGDGNDSLLGGLGNDILSGQLGNDSLDGQAGVDLYQFEGTNNAESLRLQFLTATTSQFVRKPRGLTTTLELDSLTNDATDEVSVLGLAGDDLITIDLAIAMLGVVDGGDGTDSCTAPAPWTKISC